MTTSTSARDTTANTNIATRDRHSLTMASPTSLHSPIDASAACSPRGTATFTAQWEQTDTTTLAPGNLSLTRAPRAWERKPLSPFSKKRTRSAKVWKRTATAPVEIRRRRSVGRVKGKPVKKIRLEDGAVGIAQWESEAGQEEDGAVSPVRKIVLRRDRVTEGELSALPDEEDEHADVDDGAVVEVFDEDGTLLDVDAQEMEGQKEWEDEDIEGKGMQAAYADGEAQAQAGSEQDSAATAQEAVNIATSDGEDAPTRVEHEPVEADPEAGELPEPLLGDSQPSASTQEFVLPEGFVSPVKRPPAPQRRSFRNSGGSRRRTLPTQWRPSRLRQVVNAEDEDAESIVTTSAESVKTIQREDEPDAVQEGAAEQEWEDVEDDAPEPLDVAKGDPLKDELAAEQLDQYETTETGDNLLDDATSEIESPSQSLSHGTPPRSVRPASPTKLPSSPVPTIEGQHPRLPLRRSPRRKSSSPVKQSSIRPSSEQSHLVAFTPIKGLQRLSAFDAPGSPNEVTEVTDEEPAPFVLERSVSAPPEEPQMSPHRPSRPRVSDDTALLQAFLNRAAETKSAGRRISATKRESMTNRRDSDAVRQALASPAKPEVLADLDPNSPSPRKAPAPSDDVEDTNILPEPEPSPTHKMRRSGRATRRAAPQTATPAAAPNKISIRGNSEGVVLQKTEAQTLSQATRNNTRKNKGGAVLPLYRLSKMQQQGVVDPLDDGTADAEPIEPKPNSRGRCLRWNETLVEFWQGGDVSETSLLSDEFNAPTAAPSAVDRMDVESEPGGVAAPPPPAETPSRPKIRRLKAPRTAATPGKAASAPVENAEKIEGTSRSEAPAPPPKAPTTTKRRSRIATPAKGANNTSLLPTDLEPPPAPASAPAPAPQPQQKKSLPTPSRRKPPPASKLPAPSALSYSTSTTTPALGQGKENLIAPPPKKRPSGATIPSSKTFAPKLDFSTSLAPSQSGGGSQEEVPGLASPAKKGARRLVGNSGGSSQEEGGRGGEREEMGMDLGLGLRSPAKKRTRRGLVGEH